MKVSTYACDVCKNWKKETNHWWIIVSTDPNSSMFTIMSWDEKSADSGKVIHLCGVECTLKKASELMVATPA